MLTAAAALLAAVWALSLWRSLTIIYTDHRIAGLSRGLIYHYTAVDPPAPWNRSRSPSRSSTPAPPPLSVPQQLDHVLKLMRDDPERIRLTPRAATRDDIQYVIADVILRGRPPATIPLWHSAPPADRRLPPVLFRPPSPPSGADLPVRRVRIPLAGLGAAADRCPECGTSTRSRSLLLRLVGADCKWPQATTRLMLQAGPTPSRTGPSLLPLQYESVAVGLPRKERGIGGVAHEHQGGSVGADVDKEAAGNVEDAVE